VAKLGAVRAAGCSRPPGGPPRFRENLRLLDQRAKSDPIIVRLVLAARELQPRDEPLERRLEAGVIIKGKDFREKSGFGMSQHGSSFPFSDADLWLG
jgi:hypothetical protein